MFPYTKSEEKFKPTSAALPAISHFREDNEEEEVNPHVIKDVFLNNGGRMYSFIC